MNQILKFIEEVEEIHKMDIKSYFILKKKLSSHTEIEKYEIIKLALLNNHSSLIISTLIDELKDISILNTELYDIAISNGRKNIILMLLIDYKIPLQDSKYFHLHKSIELNEWRIAKILLLYGMSPLQEDSNGHTPLWMAVDKQNIQCVKLLFDNGAVLTPDVLDLAIKKGCREIISILLSK